MLLDVRDPAWQFIGAVLGLIAIIITIIIYWFQRQKKELSYSIIAYTPFVKIVEGSEVSEKLQILYDGKEIKQLDLLVILMRNTGTGAIEKGSIEQPIYISFDENAEILTEPQIEKASNEDLKRLLDPKKSAPNSIELQPTLLNSKDSFEISILVQNNSNPPKIGGRIANVHIRERVNPEISRYSYLMLMVALLAILWIFIGAGVIELATREERTGYFYSQMTEFAQTQISPTGEN